MFYLPKDGSGLPHDPFKAIVSPRPIGWISTLDADGNANLAPYSFFNALADNPPMVMFSSTGKKGDQEYGKDTVANVRATGEFVANIVSYDLREAMNASAAVLPKGTDEFEHAGLTKAASEVVAAPYVAEAPAALECKLFQIIDLPGPHNHMVIGEVVGIHLSDAAIHDGIFDVTQYKPLSRLGYMDYDVTKKLFKMPRPQGM